MTSDLTYLTEDKTRDTVKKLADQTRQKLHGMEEEQKRMQKVAAILRRAAEDYEAALGNRIASSGFDRPLTHCRATLDVWSKLFLQALSMAATSEAQRYLQKLKQAGDPLSYIYDMLLEDADNGMISAHALRRLGAEHNTDFVRAAKIRLRRHLGLSEADVVQLARGMQFLTTADEYYFCACGEEQESLTEAIRHYRKALHLGSQAAACRLIELTKTSSAVTLQELADQMVPEANFALGMQLRSAAKYAASCTQFKLAAAKEHIPSIKILTDDMYDGFQRRRRSVLSDEDISQRNTAIHLYQYVLQKCPESEEVKERLGHLYHSLGDDRRALEYWQQCETAGAYYQRGRLFQFTNGSLPQNLDEALVCFKKASSMGHEKAGAEYNKVKRWKRDNARRAEMEEEAARSYAPRTVVSSRITESSGCFITSAVCTALGKPDNCEELTLLRAYRDAVKKDDPVVATLIAEYYRVAPMVVAKIDAELDAAQKYRQLWADAIAKTYRLVKTGHYKEATLCYIRMTEELCKRYDIAFSEGIEEKIRCVLENKLISQISIPSLRISSQ